MKISTFEQYLDKIEDTCHRYSTEFIEKFMGSDILSEIFGVYLAESESIVDYTNLKGDLSYRYIDTRKLLLWVKEKIDAER